MGAFLRKLLLKSDDVLKVLRKYKPMRKAPLRLPWRGSKSTVTKLVAKNAPKWQKIKQAGIVLGREAAIWVVMDAILNPEDADTGEVQSLRQNFVNELAAVGVDTDVDNMDALVSSIGWEQLLKVLLNSGAYVLFGEFFRANRFEVPSELRGVIQQLRGMSDDTYDALESEEDLGRIGEVPLSEALIGHQTLKQGVEPVDELGGYLGISDRDIIVRCVQLIRKTIDLELRLVKNLNAI